jgi:hypothetical protein
MAEPYTQHFWTMPMLKRAKALREAGLSYRAIATVLNLDYNELGLTGPGVRYALGKYFDLPRDYRRCRATNQLKGGPRGA